MAQTGRQSALRRRIAHQQVQNDHGLFSRLFRGKGLVLSIIFTAAVGVLVPRLIDEVDDAMGAPIVLTLTEDNHDDYTSALHETLTERDVAGVRPADLRQRVVRDGVKAGTQSAKLVLQGDASHTVVVTDIRAHILSEEPPVAGTFYSGTPEGVSGNVAVGVDLAGPDLSVREVTSVGLGAPFFAGSSVTLENDEPAVFQIDAHASGRATYTWNIEVDIVVDGVARTQSVAPDGEPFRVTSYADAYEAVVIGVSDPVALIDPVAFCDSPSSVCQEA